jgi:hypothetical protein
MAVELDRLIASDTDRSQVVYIQSQVTPLDACQTILPQHNLEEWFEVLHGRDKGGSKKFQAKDAWALVGRIDYIQLKEEME